MTTVTQEREKTVSGPPKALPLRHVSMPCRDLEEGKLFYGKVLGGELHVDTPTFASFRLGGVDVGIGTDGCTYLEPSTEYPHFAFFCGADELIQMQRMARPLRHPDLQSLDAQRRRGADVLPRSVGQHDRALLRARRSGCGEIPARTGARSWHGRRYRQTALYKLEIAVIGKPARP